MATTRQQLAALFITLLTLVMAGLVSTLEAALPRYVSQAPSSPAALTAPASQPAVTELSSKVEILRNSISFFWVGGGAVLGAYVGVAIRKITGRSNIAIHISVSLATSLAATPWILKNYVNGEPETCFFGGFLTAVTAWVAWEVIIIIGDRVKKAARDRGWIGVKQEIWGGSGQATATIAPPPVLKPQAPPGDQR